MVRTKWEGFIKTILLTGARSVACLDLIRQLHASGHRIYVAETSRWHLSRFSNAVAKSFVTPSPRFEPEDFISTLVSIAEKENIDYLIPTWEEIFVLAKHLDKFPAHCKVFSSSFETLHNLHNKWFFTKKLKSLGFPVPKSQLIQSNDEIQSLSSEPPYVLKPCYSRASTYIQKVKTDDPKPIVNIEPFNPWIAQEWIDGKKICTFSVCKNGQVQAHATYPVNYAIYETNCISFEPIYHEGVLEWIKHFAAQENFTGQIGFDFIEAEDGTLYAIDCNPRTTHGLLLFQQDDHLDRAFIEEGLETIHPKPTAKKQIAMAMMLYGWKSEKGKSNMKGYFKDLFTTQDTIFNFKDIKPCLSMFFIFAKYFWESKKLGLPMTASFSYDLEWDGEGNF